MMKCKLIVKILAVITTVSLFMTGCGAKPGEKTGSAKAGNVAIRVGYFPNLTHAQALVGLNNGTFQKALGDHVTIEERVFNAGPAEIEALLAGEIDLGYIGPVPAINGYVKSKGELKIIAGAADAGAVLVAAKSVEIKKASDLNGKKVAVPQLGNTQDISLRQLLAEANLKDAAKGGTVSVIPAENPDILTLLTKGDVDAALVPEPWGSRIVKQAGASVVLDAKQVWRDGKYSTAVVVVSTRFLKEHPDLVRKWIQAHVEVTERINREKEVCQQAANAQLLKLTKKSLTDDILSSSFNRIAVTYNPESDSLKDFARISADNRYIREEPDVSDLMDLTILNQVLETKGLQKVE